VKRRQKIFNFKPIEKPENASITPQRSMVIKVFKVGIFLMLIIAPIVILMAVITPFTGSKSREHSLEKYALSDGFDYDEFDRFFARLRTDAEYSFYFMALESDKQDAIQNEIYSMLDKNRTKSRLLHQINSTREKVRAVTVLFTKFDFKDDFKGNMDVYPGLEPVIWQFIEEEFKLTILGLCYKATYQPNFIFEWSAPARLSAQRLRYIVERSKRKKVLYIK